MERNKILIVDDTLSLLKLGKAIFESGGYDVLTATDGIEALQLIAINTVALIITDILMPNMDGYSLCHSIRNDEKNKNIPIIVYSATYISKSDEALAIDIGADMFIRKPASAIFLLDAAKNLISRPRRADTGFSSRHDLTDVMRQYSSRLIEKLEDKNHELEITNTRLLFHIENTPLGFIEWDERLQVKSWSKRTEEIFGWTEQEFMKLQKDGYSQVYEEDLPWVSEIAQQLLTGAVEKNTVTHRNYTKDGRVIWCEWFNSALKDKNGKVITLMSLVQDVTNRKITEDRLKYSEQRLRQAQEIAHVGNWELNFSTGVALWSDEACRIYGLAPHDNVQSYQSWVSFIHPDDLEYVMKVTTEGQNALTSSGFFHRIKRRDGNVRHIFSHAQYEFNNDKQPIGLYGIVHDVTEIKEAEEAFHQSAANLSIIVDLIPQGVFAKDYNGKFVFVNKSFAMLYGLEPSQLMNKTIAETIPGKNDPEAFVIQDREIINTGVTKIIPEMKFTDYNGKERIFYTIKVPYTIPGSNEKAVLGITLDITEQKVAEAERTIMIADIVQRNKDLEQFSYIVSHNLRAPVANIIGLSDLLPMMEHDKNEQKVMMEELTTSVTKLDMVIKDLNYILQVKNQISENREAVRFSDLLSDIKLSIATALRSEHVKIKSDFSAMEEMHALKSYLHSIFFNLVTNGIKYRRPGVQPELEITSYKDNDTITLAFKDNGLGIDLAQKGKYLFGLYKRFHTHTEGKGMGLYMVKTQVEAMGGRIYVESEVDTGTTFKIVFETK